mgnify:CR=1 FL=1
MLEVAQKSSLTAERLHIKAFASAAKLNLSPSPIYINVHHPIPTMSKSAPTLRIKLARVDDVREIADLRQEASFRIYDLWHVSCIRRLLIKTIPYLIIPIHVTKTRVKKKCFWSMKKSRKH